MCLDPIVPEGMSQVSRRSEFVYINSAPSTPGYLLALQRELSQCPRALTYEAGTKNEPDTYFVPVQKMGWKIDPHVSNLRSRVCCFVLLNRYWGIVTVPGSFLKAGDLGWPDPHPSP